MDISEAYIKMCDCPEIQGQWKPEEGDWNTSGSYLGCVGDTVCETEGFDSYEDAIKEMKNNYTWLPRQDQIQEMMGEDFPFIARYFASHVEDCMEPGQDGSVLETPCESMEQFWLAFYMLEKHRKFWDGEKWGARRHG